MEIWFMKADQVGRMQEEREHPDRSWSANYILMLKSHPLIRVKDLVGYQALGEVRDFYET